MADANCGWKLRMEIADDPLSDRLTLVSFPDITTSDETMQSPEGVLQNVVLKISETSQENTYVRVCF